jgi:hypothetical protein
MLSALGGPAAKAALVAALTTAVEEHLKAAGGTWAQRLLGGTSTGTGGGGSSSSLVSDWMAAAVDNWLNMDLFTAGVRFLNNARGSFGMALMCSLDHDR